MCCFNPAKIFGLDKNKGTIAPGMDADFILYDPSKKNIVSQDNMHSAGDYTIWERLQLKGYPVSTYSRGVLVQKNGEFLGSPGNGRFLNSFT